jgi:hypothetical protein
MPLRLPRVFLSSTFYDLRYLRAELDRFVSETLGYEVLASEHPSFPTDPDATTVENCVRRVREEANILILVVGGRYGQVPDDGDQSVTNMEYVAARAKGIPIYAFVLKDVLDLLPVFEQTPGADFSRVVETPRLLEFVKALREEDRIWVFPFETAADIADVLKVQFAYRFAAGLDAELRMRSDPEGLRGLHGEALRLAVEKPPAWQGYFLVECLRQELARHRAEYEAYRVGASWGVSERPDDRFAWVSQRIEDLTRLPEGLVPVMNQLLNEAMGAADVRRIASGAEVFGNAFKSALDWVANVRRARLGADCEALRAVVSRAPASMISEMMQLPNKVEAQIRSGVAADPKTKQIVLEFVLSLPPGWEDAVSGELSVLKQRC